MRSNLASRSIAPGYRLLSSRAYAHGVCDEPLLSETIGQRLTAAARDHGHLIALVSRHQQRRFTFSELNDLAEQCAAGLLELGAERGDRVGIFSPNRFEWVVAQLATAKAGMVLVNVNPAYRAHELEYALNKVGVSTLITAKSFKTSCYTDMVASIAPEFAATDADPRNVTSSAVPSLRRVVCLDGPGPMHPGMLDFDSLLNAATPGAVARVRDLEANVVQFDDPVNIQFTSGTTGSPKGATLSHHNILNNAHFCGRRLGYTSEDRIIVPVPLYHCFGLGLGVLAGLSCLSTVVLPSEGFDAAAAVDAISAERGTSIYGVPTMFVAMFEYIDKQGGKIDTSSLRTGIMAGSPCPAALMRRVVEDMGAVEMSVAYGQTETAPLSFQTLRSDPPEARIGTIGRVHPHVEVKIVDRETGTIVPRGQQGELCTRGYSVMLGYWGDEERTKETMDGNWLRSGDLAVMDDDGLCRITGRVKDMIIRGGENIYPREIEEFMLAQFRDTIADVQVFGVPSDKFGEEVCAWIQVREGKTMTVEDVVAGCRSEIAHYKIPKYIEFVKEYPMTVTGKIQKFRCTESMVAQHAPNGKSFP